MWMEDFSQIYHVPIYLKIHINIYKVEYIFNIINIVNHEIVFLNKILHLYIAVCFWPHHSVGHSDFYSKQQHWDIFWITLYN